MSDLHFDPSLTPPWLALASEAVDGEALVGYKNRAHASVTREGITREDRGAGRLYRVTPAGEPTKARDACWKRLRARWQRAGYKVAETPEGASVLVPLTPYQYRKLWAALLPDREPGELPVSWGDAVEPEAPLTPGAARLARKVAKRTKGELPVAFLRDLVASLPGWTWDEAIAPRRVTERTGRRLRRLVGDAGLDLVRVPFARTDKTAVLVANAWVGSEARHRPAVTPAQRDALGARLRVQSAVTRPPQTIRLGEFAATELVGRTEWDEPVLSLGVVWEGVPSWIVETPDGDRFAIPRKHAAGDKTGRDGQPLPEPPEPVYDDTEGFWPWACAHGFGEAVDALLASFSPEEIEELTRAASEQTPEHTGECQICLRRTKLRDRDNGMPVLVDHGYHYRVPRRQWVVGQMLGPREGRCCGVGHPPWELDHSAFDSYIKSVLRRELVGIEAALCRLRSGTETLRGWGPDGKPVEFAPGDEGYERVSRLAHDEWDRQRLRKQREVARAEARAASWQRQPLYDETVALVHAGA